MCLMLMMFLHIIALIGFTSIGDVNFHLVAFEQSEGQNEDELANSMLVLLVQGVFNSRHFPYVQLPCSEPSREQMYTVL